MMIYEIQVDRYSCVDGKHIRVDYTYEHKLRGVSMWMVKIFVDFTLCLVIFDRNLYVCIHKYVDVYVYTPIYVV